MEKELIQGKVYKIILPNNYFYYGSTKNSLQKRLSKHKSDLKNKTTKLYLHINNNKIDFKDIEIKLIEYIECENIEELRKLENEYIKKEINKEFCLNEIHSQTNQNEYKKQYYVNNKNEISEYCKKYYEKNKERFLEKQKEKIICEICKKEITKGHKSRHEKSTFHKKFINNNITNYGTINIYN